LHWSSAAVETFGAVDILVNNAQIQRQQVSFEGTSDDDMDVVLTSGIHATFYFMQACLPQLRQKGGKVINVASAAGLLGHPGWTSYAVAKEGIRALTKVAAREWGIHKINVNAICPAAETPSFRL
jgi:NAD(P)-dependent dehydrogenase (short-subunit alcohol dehydrogenase family)